jgi:hypothetical protein
VLRHQPFFRYFAVFCPFCARNARLWIFWDATLITRLGMSLLIYLSLQLEPQHSLLRFTQRPLCLRYSRLQ